MEKLKADNKFLKADVKYLREEITGLREVIRELIEKKEELEENKSDLEYSLESLKKAISLGEKGWVKGGELYDLYVLPLKEENEKLKKENEELKEKNDELECEPCPAHNSALDEIIQLEGRIKELEDERPCEELYKAYKENEELKEENEKLKEENEKLNSGYSDIWNGVFNILDDAGIDATSQGKLIAGVRTLKEENDELEEKNEKLKEELDVLSLA